MHHIVFDRIFFIIIVLSLLVWGYKHNSGSVLKLFRIHITHVICTNVDGHLIVSNFFKL